MNATPGGRAHQERSTSRGGAKPLQKLTVVRLSGPYVDEIPYDQNDIGSEANRDILVIGAYLGFRVWSFEFPASLSM